MPGFVERMRAAVRRVLRRGPRVIAVHPFDETHGIETSGLIESKQLVSGHPHDEHCTAYFAVPPSRFNAAIDLWARDLRATTAESVPFAEYAFVDIGCGKGRAVLLACERGFREVMGVELNPTLARQAEQNLQRWQDAHKSRIDAQILSADAVAAIPVMPPSPLLIYLYNPFRAAVLRPFLDVLVRTYEQRDTALDILYLYPLEDAVFAEFPVFECIWHKDVSLAADEAADGISSPTDPCSLYRLKAAVQSASLQDQKAGYPLHTADPPN